MPKFKLIVETGFPGAQHEGEVEFPQEYWESLSKEQREKALNQEARDFMHERIECYWEEAED
jgi:hypothetical protein